MSGTFRKNTLLMITLSKNTLSRSKKLGDGGDLNGDGSDVLGDGGKISGKKCNLPTDLRTYLHLTWVVARDTCVTKNHKRFPNVAGFTVRGPICHEPSLMPLFESARG